MIDYDSLVPRPDDNRGEDWLTAYRRGLVDVPICAENGAFSTRFEDVLDT